MVRMVDIVGEIRPGRIVQAPSKNSGDFSNRDCKYASRSYFAALSRPHSCVPAVLDELE